MQIEVENVALSRTEEKDKMIETVIKKYKIPFFKNRKTNGKSQLLPTGRKTNRPFQGFEKTKNGE